MEEPNSYATWLETRYPYDSEARNKSLEAVVRTYLASKEKINLVDVGAGTGSNALYLMDKIDAHQHWYFIEQNEGFQEFLLHRLKEYATYHKYEYAVQKNIHYIRSSNKQLSFQLINGSLLDIAQLVPLQHVDIVLANAVFDLFTKQQIQTFLSPIQSAATACYFTLNYQSMRYQPTEPFDKTYVNLYEQHMERPQVHGQAAGKHASNYIDTFLNASYTIQQAQSTWNIQEEDIKMHYYLLNFMENSIPELALEEELGNFFPKWIQRKKELAINRQLSLEVHHQDIFCIPDIGGMVVR